jgi:hypothetical protein
MSEQGFGPETVSPLLLELARAIRARQFYPPSHPALHDTLQRCAEVWRDGIGRMEGLSLELVRGSFVLPDGALVHGPGIDDMAAELRVRGVRRLRIHRNLEASELMALIDALNQNAEEQVAAGGLEQTLLQAGVRHITTSEIDFAEHLRRFEEPAGETPQEAPELAAVAEPMTQSEAETPAAESIELLSREEPEIDALRARLISELTKLLGVLESCEEIADYNHVSGRINNLVAQMMQGKNDIDAYRAVLVYCRHAGDTLGRSAAIRQEATSRLRYLMEDPSLLDLVMKQACSREGLSTVQATQILTALGPQVVPDLLERSEQGDALGESQVTAILIAMGDVAFPCIVDELNSGTPEKVLRAVRLLGRMQNPRGVDCLLDRLIEPNRELRHEIMRALARIGTARAVKGLIDAAREFPELAELVAGCLGDTRSEAAIQALCGILRPKAKYNNNVKREAIRSLGRIRSTIALPTLNQVLNQSSFFFRSGSTRMLRITAAQAIGKIGGPEASAILGAHARRGDPAVQKACRESLERMARSEVS